MKVILFFKRPDGSSPVEEFIDGLTDKQAQKVVWVLGLIEDMDIIPSQYWKKLTNTDEIWEARIQFGGNIFRILGFEHGGSFVVLTNGFAKKTQKTPRNEIALAEQRRSKYLKENL
ncbi:MAG: type II toxin-antitoxin system RelE/ParE family toxin [Opitutales bacterium]|nr:type II toxin-antitoxin system RelE/ParE family toxin [Opitutales bacterium]